MVADALDLVEFKAGEAVFAQGEAGDKFYCIKEGTGGRTWVGWKGRKEGGEGEEERKNVVRGCWKRRHWEGRWGAMGACQRWLSAPRGGSIRWH